MDTFPALVIYLSLVALSKDPGLWPALYNGDNLLFQTADFFPHSKRRSGCGLPPCTIRKSTIWRCLRKCSAPDWVATESLDRTIDQARPELLDHA